MKKIYLVGIGMGNIDTLTEMGRRVIEASELLIGAERMVNAFPAYQGDVCCAVSPARIMDAILEHPGCQTVAVVFSGDVGFFSGAKKVSQAIDEQKRAGRPAEDGNRNGSHEEAGDRNGSPWDEYETEFIPGISSLQYFSSRLKTSWEDMKVVSLHGREDNVIGVIRNNGRTFILTGGDYSVQGICRLLCENRLQEAVVHVGERLSYKNERIVSGTAEELAKVGFDPLAVMLVENQNAMKRDVITHGIKDELFLRGRVPMTKSEIRSVSLSKLQLRSSDVVYDIGAGTGSVSVELALQAFEGSVYAVEFKEEALSLIRENADRFGVTNLEAVEGKAPEALIDLPVPDRAFIGGSGGNLCGILELLAEKNPNVRVVVNAITLETLTEAVNCFQKLGFKETEIVQVFAADGKEVGGYHMMTGHNPVFIISGERKKECCEGNLTE